MYIEVKLKESAIGIHIGKSSMLLEGICSQKNHFRCSTSFASPRSAVFLLGNKKNRQPDATPLWLNTGLVPADTRVYSVFLFAVATEYQVVPITKQIILSKQFGTDSVRRRELHIINAVKAACLEIICCHGWFAGHGQF